MIGQFRAELLSMVEETVRRMLPSLRGQDTALGTLVYRDATGLAGLVQFDGDDQALPVKISGAVDTRTQDRVALVRTGAYWMVVGTLSMGGMAEASRRGIIGADSTSSTSYATLGSIPATSFQKLHTATALRIGIGMSAYSTATATPMRIGARITGTSFEGVSYDSGDMDVKHFNFNESNSHRDFSGVIRTFDNGIPPGDYSLAVRWRRVSGSGTITTDSNDWYWVEIDEIRRQAT